MKTYDTYIDSWEHGQIYYNGPGYQKTWYGPCPECGSRTTNYGGSIVCVDWYCKHTTNRQCINPINPQPSWWNSEMNVQKDGDQWCAFKDGFINLQESEAGFGNSPSLAIADYHKFMGES